MWTRLHFSFSNWKSSVFEKVKWWSLSHLLSSPLLPGCFNPLSHGEKEGEKTGREERGRQGERDRTYQTTFIPEYRQSSAHYPSLPLPSEQSSPLPPRSHCIQVEESPFQGLPLFYTWKDFLYCFSSSRKMSNLPITCSPERGKDPLEMYQVPPTNILKIKDI